MPTLEEFLDPETIARLRSTGADVDAPPAAAVPAAPPEAPAPGNAGADVMSPELSAKRAIYNQFAANNFAPGADPRGVVGPNFTFGPNGETPANFNPEHWKKAEQKYNFEEQGRQRVAAQEAAAKAQLDAIKAKAGINPAATAAAAPTDGKSLFDMVSGQLQAQQKAGNVGVTPPNGATAGARAPADDSGDGDSSSMSSKPSVADQLAQRRQDMSDAQQAAGSNQLVAGLARAGGTLAHAISGAKAPMDEAGFNALEANAGTPVTNVQNRQASELKDLQEQQGMMQTQQMQDMQNPDSAQSQAFRKSVEKLAPGIAAQYGDSWGQVTAADKDLILKPIEMREQMNSRLANTALAKAMIAGKDQEKAYTEMRGKLETFRGNQAAQQASRDILAGKKALAMIEGRDPNSLTFQDLYTLAEEQGKIASGGIPNEGGVQALLPNTGSQKLAQLASQILNSPKGANAGEFVKHNLSYIKEMMGAAQGTISDFRRNIAKGYKHRVKPDEYEEAMNDYQLNPPPSAQPPGAAPAAAGLPFSASDIDAELAKRK